MYDKDGKYVVKTLEKVTLTCGILRRPLPSSSRKFPTVMLMDAGGVVAVAYEFRTGGFTGRERAVDGVGARWEGGLVGDGGLSMLQLGGLVE